jgi:hypothetical protein
LFDKSLGSQWHELLLRPENLQPLWELFGALTNNFVCEVGAAGQ